MSYVLTCVASDYSMLDLLPAVHKALAGIGLAVDRFDWLNPGRACDLFLRVGPEFEPAVTEQAVRTILAGTKIDLAVQATAGRRKVLLLADMESTIIRNEMLEELADFVGKRAEVEAITRRAMNGELDFRAALAERVALLRGLPEQVLEDCLESIRFDPGARVLVATLRTHGAYTALVSGGFTYFAMWVAQRVGFDNFQANALAVADGRLTGEVTEPVLDRDAKRRALDEFCAALGISAEGAVAVGDGANDLPMLQAAGLGVAYHGKPAVAAAARFRVDHGDLSTLLYFQGYRSAEFCQAG